MLSLILKSKESIIGAAIATIFSTLLFSINVCGETNSLANQRYVDTTGYFTVLPPANWKVQRYPNDSRGKVAFHSPTDNVSLRILAAREDNISTIDELIKGSKRIEKRIGKSTNIVKTTFYGRPAVKRSFIFNGVKLLAYDFLVGNIHHNIQFGAPPSEYQEYYSWAKKSMETYEAALRPGDSGNAVEDALAGKRRLAELFVEVGRVDLALEYIMEGLELNPSDVRLLELKETIKKGK